MRENSKLLIGNESPIKPKAGTLKKDEEIIINLDKEEEKSNLVIPHTELTQSESIFLICQCIETQVINLNPQTTNYQFWNIDFYKPYFDISTNIAINRAYKALWPFQPQTFLESELHLDLYVPFWNYVTLVLTMSVLYHILTGFSDTDATRKIISCFTSFGMYIGVTPTIVYFVQKFKGGELSLPALVSLYGYSLVIYAPMSILYLMPYQLFRLLILLGAAGISLYFLERNLGALCDKCLERNAIFGRIFAVGAKCLLVYAICFRIY